MPLFAPPYATVKLPLLLFVLLLGFNSTCTAQPPLPQIKFPNGKVCLFLDSVAAGQAITYDVTDDFFDKISVGEMSIQMQQPLQAGQDRASMMSNYQRYLKQDVTGFSAEETEFLSKVMQKVYENTQKVSPDLMPDTLKLIKTTCRHYGEGVWYTRENCIIIPADELARKKTAPFSTTVYHELFHVWSRLHPEKRAKAYQLIGFQTIGYENLEMPAALAERVLFNPDGVDFAQRIVLQQEDGSSKMAVPIIYANNLGWTAQQNTFFAYLEFSLFEIQPTGNGKYRVITKEDGISPTLSMDSQPDFHRQIKDNTGYIIHPDEVLADNFSFIMQGKNGQNITMRFSEGGKQLLKDLEAVISGK